LHNTTPPRRVSKTRFRQRAEAIGLHAVYPSTRNLSGKVWGFIDFLIERFGDEPFWDRTIFRGSTQTRSDQA
jgi:hypothetical protein